MSLDFWLAGNVWFRGEINIKINWSVKTPLHKYMKVVRSWSYVLLTMLDPCSYFYEYYILIVVVSFFIFSCSQQELTCHQLWKPLLFSQPYWLSLAFVKRVGLMACAPSLAVVAIQNTVTEDIAGQKVVNWARASGDFSWTRVYLICPASATPSYVIRRR